MKAYPRNGMWNVEFMEDGKRKRVSTGLKCSTSSEADALKAGEIRRRQLRMKDGAPLGTTGVNWSMSEALERTWQVRWQGSKAARGVRQRIELLHAQVGFWMLKDITYKQLLELQQGWAKQFANATVNRRMSLLKTAMKCAKREEPSLPAPDFPQLLREANHKDRYLTAEEEARVQKWLEEKVAIEQATNRIRGESDDNWQAAMDAFHILMDTGMRRGELLGLTLANFDGTRVLLRAGTTKNDRARQVPLTSRARSAVKRWLTYTPRRTENWLHVKWDQVREHCDIKDVNLHILRHTCASRLVQKGVSLYVVSKWLGHSSMKVTERYAHLAPDMFGEALARLEGDFGTTGDGKVPRAE